MTKDVLRSEISILFVEFLQTIDAVGYANFYLNAEVGDDTRSFDKTRNDLFNLQAFRCAGISVQQQINADMTPEQHRASLEALRNMANGLIEQYFLPSVRTVFLSFPHGNRDNRNLVNEIPIE